MNSIEKNNLNKFSSKSSVQFYKDYVDLQDCEKYIFDKHIKSSFSILDIGIGAGRTTLHLNNHVKDYIGIDYSEEMIDAAKEKFPYLNLLVMNAEKLNFPTNNFDLLLFSFNGIDYFGSSSERDNFFQEASRVLKPSSKLIFSSHNINCYVLAPSLSNVNIIKKTWRILRTFITTIKHLLMLLRYNLIFKDHGYIWDKTHGGLKTFISSVSYFERELDKHGFDLSEVIPSHISSGLKFLSPWIYYVAIKRK